MYNPYQEYKKQSVMTMTPGDMIVKLYDECIADLRLALIYMEENKIEERFSSLKKAREIISYLREILNMDIELSNNLFALYDYFIAQILDANVHSKKEPVQEVIGMLADLRNGFYEAEKSLRAGSAKVIAPNKGYQPMAFSG